MDLRDFQILVEFSRHPFGSYATIGRAIGRSGNAVKSRVNRMTRSGLLRGYFVMPRAGLFGRTWHVYAYANPQLEPSFEEILTVEDVVNVWRGPPHSLMVNTFARTRGGPPPAGLAKFLRGPPLGVVLPDPPDGLSAAEGTLSPLDWRVLDALLDRPRAPLSELARASGLSARTVRRHRDALVRKGLINVVVNLDTSRETGLIVYSGYIAVRSREYLNRIRAPGLQIIHQLHEPPAAWALGHAPSLAGLQEVEATLRAIPGVMAVELVPSRGGAFANQRLHEWIRREIQRWQTLRPPSSAARGETTRTRRQTDAPTTSVQVRVRSPRRS